MYKKNKKPGIILVCAMLICTMFCTTPTFAASYDGYGASNEIFCAFGAYEPMVKKTEWRYRNYNGHLQRRLWSVDSGKWLTEWEDC